MAERTRKKVAAKRKPALDRERVLRAAIGLADSGGIGSLSMRRLGQRLGVEAMSLYNHVANKEEVLSGIVDIILGDIEIVESAISWKESMRGRAASMRKVFALHPWAVGLLESRRDPGPAALRYCDSVLGVLRRAGFSTQTAVRAFSILDSYAYGYSIQEKSLSPRPPTEAARETERFLRQLPAAEYPYLTETATHVATSGFDYTKEFEIGLELLLDALGNWRGPEGT